MQGSIFWSKNHIYFPPPSCENYIFTPYRNTSFFNFYIMPFFLPQFFPILHLFYPLLPILSFSTPLLPFSSSSTFSYIFPLFSSPFHSFPPNDISWYSSPKEARVSFPIDPCCWVRKLFSVPQILILLLSNSSDTQLIRIETSQIQILKLSDQIPVLNLSEKQCFGSGSGWIRIQFGPGFGIRIQILEPDVLKKV